MLQLAGEEQFTQTQADVWAHITDMKFLSQCIPGLDEVDRIEPRLLVFRVRPGLAFLKGTLKTTLEIYDEQPPDSLRMRTQSKGIGSSARVETQIELSANEAGTRLSWSAEVKELGGLLKPVGHSLVSAAAKKAIADGWVGFREALSSGGES